MRLSVGDVISELLDTPEKLQPDPNWPNYASIVIITIAYITGLINRLTGSLV